MKNVMLMLMVVLVVGCASQQKTEPLVVVQKVEIEKAIPCVKEIQIPVAPQSQFDALPENAPSFKQTQALLIDREADHSVMTKLFVIANGCSRLK